MEFQKDILLFLNQEIYEQMKSCVNKARPNEASGILIGRIKQIEIAGHKNDYIYHYIAKKFSCIESDRKSPVAFLISNIEKLNEIIERKKKELEIDENLDEKSRLISIFHSHPGGSYPSSMDIDYMKYLDNFSKLEKNYISKAFKNQIWTIMDGQNYDLNGFIYINNELYQEKLFQIDVRIKKE